MLGSFLTNIPQARCQRLSNTYLLCNFGRKSCIWLNQRNGHQMLCFRPLEYLLQIWVWKRQNVFLSLSCFHGSGKIFRRIRDYILPCTSLWRSLYINQLPSIRGFCFHFVRCEIVLSFKIGIENFQSLALVEYWSDPFFYLSIPPIFVFT